MGRMNKGRKDKLESHRSALNTLVGAFPVSGKVYAAVALNEFLKRIKEILEDIAE